MDAEILLPEIRLFGLNLVCHSNQISRVSPAPKISKARRRKIRLMKQKNSMVSSSFKSERPDDGSYQVNNGDEAQPPALVGGGIGSPIDSAISAPSVVNLVDSHVVLAAVQSQLPRYNLRPRVPSFL